MPRLCILLVLSFLSGGVSAQQRVNPRNQFERILCVMPVAGKGTHDDPVRPVYAPAAAVLAARTGILGYAHVMSDDGKFALVELVAKDRKAFAAILADATVKSFVKGTHKREDIEAEFKRYKHDFRFEMLTVRVN